MDTAAKLLKTPKSAEGAALVCLSAASSQPGAQAAVQSLLQKIRSSGGRVRAISFAQGGAAAESLLEDIFDWHSSASTPCQQLHTDSAAAAAQPAKQVLVLRSICSLLQFLSAAEILQLVSRLRSLSQVQSILVTFQLRKSTSNLQSQLKAQVTAWCELHAPSSTANALGSHGTWTTTTCRRTGRLERVTEAFCLLESGGMHILTLQPKAVAQPISSSHSSLAQKGIASRAEMDAAVESARQGVVLPHEQLRKLGLAKPVFGETAALQTALQKAAVGSIHYVRDSDSDHDSDEDPDDDLDM